MLRSMTVSRIRRDTGILAIAAVVLAGVAGDPAAVRAARAEDSLPPGSVAFNYRNHPALEGLVGFETVVLSPVAVEARSALRQRGARVLVWLQPFVCTWRGHPPARGTLLGDAYALADSLGAWLQDKYGVSARIRDVDVDDCAVYDFRHAAFVEGLADLVTAHLDDVDGVLLDYGCPSLGWERSLADVDEGVWKAWSAGHLQYMQALRRRQPDWRILCQCQHWGSELPARCDGLVLERVGWSLNPYRQVLEEAARRPEKRSILMIVDALGHEDPVRRRITAALALLLDFGFAYRLEDGFGPHNVRGPEHFELDLGAWAGPLREVRAGVYLREAANGFAVVNLSQEPFAWGEETVPAGDARTVQTHDAVSGEPIPWRRAGLP